MARRHLTSDDWGRLRKEAAVLAMVQRCPDEHVAFLLRSTLFALFISDAVGRLGDNPSTAARTWLPRLVRAQTWALRNAVRKGGEELVDWEGYDDQEAAEWFLTMADAVAVILGFPKADAGAIHRVVDAEPQPSTADLDRARRVFLNKVVPALNARYAPENVPN